MNKSLPVLFSIFLLSSCAQYYAPALMKADLVYQPKPMSIDSVKVGNYVSGAFAASRGDRRGNDITFGELNILRSHTSELFSASYGFYGFTGRIKDNKTATDYVREFRRKNFGGLGLRASANLNNVSGNTNFRYLGLEAGYSKEFGEYSEFRKGISPNPDSYSITRTGLFTSGLTSEIIWQGRNRSETQYSFRLFIGKTFGDNSYSRMNHTRDPLEEPDVVVFRTNSFRSSLSFFFKYRKTFFIFENGSFRSAKFALGYNL